MRPLTLKISGLRSYRTEQTIDFSDGGLMAIVGDTGAGKSSILDALFFALYGGCTWDRRSVIPLISDGVPMMQVELVFGAEGQRWRVFRAASRAGPGGRHELTCLDDPTVRYDNSDPVTAAVRKLVGLDDEAFLRTVILPQGRFQALLHAAKGDRTAILKGIFRLEQLAAVRDAADHAARRLRPGIGELKGERARLHEDPVAALNDAETREQGAKARESTLHALAERVTTVQTAKAHNETRAAELRRLVERIAAEGRPGAAERLAELASNAATIDAELDALALQREQLRSTVEGLEAVLRGADEAGVGVAHLAAATGTLESLLTQLPALAADATACGHERVEIEQVTASVKEDESAVTDLVELAGVAKGEAEVALAAWREATGRVDEARRRLASARRAKVEADTVDNEVAQNAEGLERLRVAVASAELALTDAETARDDAEAELESLLRANAAAHAAEGAHPGDPCPICNRPLPDDFDAAPVTGDTETRGRLAEAKASLEVARNERDKTKTALSVREATIAEAEKHLTGLVAEAAAALAELRELIPQATLDRDDVALLQGLTASAAECEGHAQTAAAQATSRQQQVATATNRIEATTAEIERRTKSLNRRLEAVEARSRSCEKAASGLPAPYRPAVPLEPAMLTEMAARVDKQRSELAAIDRKLTSARAELQRVDTRHDESTRHRRAAVEKPVQELDVRLVAVSQRLGDLVGALTAGAVPARPAGSITELARWAHDLGDAVADAVERSEVALQALGQEAGELAASVDAALAEQGFTSHQELADARIQVAADLSLARKDAGTARDQIPRAATLDTVIDKGGALLDALDELARLLADGKFIGYVVARKQQTLLAVASEILGSITGTRYGFSENFEIIDRLTGLPRGVKTLSGGETFLASLALALGLVELAGRGGGRLDALFLDEGFGSLDANSLSEALDALGRQAEGGRLVVVISHLRTVADAVEHLVAVTRGPDGSRIQPLGGTERDQLVVEEIEAGLLS